MTKRLLGLALVLFIANWAYAKKAKAPAPAAPPSVSEDEYSDSETTDSDSDPAPALTAKSSDEVYMDDGEEMTSDEVEASAVKPPAPAVVKPPAAKVKAPSVKAEENKPQQAEPKRKTASVGLFMTTKTSCPLLSEPVEGGQPVLTARPSRKLWVEPVDENWVRAFGRNGEHRYMNRNCF